jgi:hypothetical protein
MDKKKNSKDTPEHIQDELETEKLEPPKYEDRYKHGGPMRTVKKKKD